MFTGIVWDITAAEILNGAVDFVMVFKEFLVLGLVVLFAPYLVTFFKGILRKNSRA